MTITDQIKILNKKIMQNEAQYDLDRKAAKISALSSNNLDKYEYLTDEDLGLKPNTIEQARFDNSSFNYLKSLSQEAKDLMDEIEDADDDIDDSKLLFTGSNKEKFNFNTFKNSLNFISAIYNGKMSLKEAEFSQKKLEKKNRGSKI